jgi:transcriptional regulator with XRE-family HTH domain
MAKPSQNQRTYNHSWYLLEWAERAGLKQADVARLAGWSKAKGSDVWNGQRYTQELIDELAPILNVRPFELLMHPDDAIAIRNVREEAARLVAISERLPDLKPVAAAAAKRGTGTNG